MRRLFAVLLLCCGLVSAALAADLQSELLAMDKALWTAWSKKDGEPYTKVLAADAVQIVAGSKPLWGRDAIVKEVISHNCEVKSFAFKDARLRKLGADVAVLTHIATQDVTCGTQKLPPTVASTSIYVKQKGMWMSAFYQETPLE